MRIPQVTLSLPAAMQLLLWHGTVSGLPVNPGGSALPQGPSDIRTIPKVNSVPRMGTGQIGWNPLVAGASAPLKAGISASSPLGVSSVKPGAVAASNPLTPGISASSPLAVVPVRAASPANPLGPGVGGSNPLSLATEGGGSSSLVSTVARLSPLAPSIGQGGPLAVSNFESTQSGPWDIGRRLNERMSQRTGEFSPENGLANIGERFPLGSLPAAAPQPVQPVVSNRRTESGPLDAAVSGPLDAGGPALQSGPLAESGQSAPGSGRNSPGSTVVSDASRRTSPWQAMVPDKPTVRISGAGISVEDASEEQLFDGTFRTTPYGRDPDIYHDISKVKSPSSSSATSSRGRSRNVATSQGRDPDAYSDPWDATSGANAETSTRGHSLNVATSQGRDPNIYHDISKDKSPYSSSATSSRGRSQNGPGVEISQGRTWATKLAKSRAHSKKMRDSQGIDSEFDAISPWYSSPGSPSETPSQPAPKKADIPSHSVKGLSLSSEKSPAMALIGPRVDGPLLSQSPGTIISKVWNKVRGSKTPKTAGLAWIDDGGYEERDGKLYSHYSYNGHVPSTAAEARRVTPSDLTWYQKRNVWLRWKTNPKGELVYTIQPAAGPDAAKYKKNVQLYEKDGKLHAPSGRVLPGSILDAGATRFYTKEKVWVRFEMADDKKVFVRMPLPAEPGFTHNVKGMKATIDRNSGITNDPTHEYLPNVATSNAGYANAGVANAGAASAGAGTSSAGAGAAGAGASSAGAGAADTSTASAGTGAADTSTASAGTGAADTLTASAGTGAADAAVAV